MTYREAQITMTLSEVEGHVVSANDKARHGCHCICRASYTKVTNDRGVAMWLF